MTHLLLSPLRAWLQRHWVRLIASSEDSRPLARGMALGTFLGFSPFFGLKTLLALLLARALRGSSLAAVFGVTLHDLLLPLAPLIARWEYDLGFWLLSHPHRWPTALRMGELHIQQCANWQTLSETVGPLLLGCTIVGAPFALVAYLLTQRVLVKGRLPASA